MAKKVNKRDYEKLEKRQKSKCFLSYTGNILSKYISLNLSSSDTQYGNPLTFSIP